MANILLTAPNAKFGRLEVNIGTTASGSGSQRLAHSMSKSRGMVLMLMGRMWSAQEAAAWGTVRMTRASRVLVVMFSFRLLPRGRIWPFLTLKPGLKPEPSRAGPGSEFL